MIKRIENASTQGIRFIKDVRYIESVYGLGDTFSFATRYLDYEQYFTFIGETATSLTLSIVAVLIVVLVITSDVVCTLLVAMCVAMTDLFLAGLIWGWGLTVNPIVMVNVIVAIGTSVDYSAHIAYAYLVETVPDTHKCRSLESIRIYKAQMALSKMGSSVFHGGFSTFIAIVVLSPSKTYVFVVFFRCWFGIILFGMANGFLLLPVVLSFVGPARTLIDPSLVKVESE